MDPNNLVALQQSTKKIRNPFKFDFTCKWAGKPITLPGDGQWYPVIAPLADHIANRLYMKIRYQFHDEQVAAMKAKGDKDGARGYRVPAEIENKIFMLITGRPIHTGLPVAEDIESEADLTELKAEMKKLESKGINSSGISVTKLLEQATAEAMPLMDKVDGQEDSGHMAGSANLNPEAAPEQPIDTTPVNVADLNGANPSILPASDDNPVLRTVAPQQEVAQSEAPSNEDRAFGELSELDNQNERQQPIQ